MNIWYLSAYDQPKGQSSRTYDFSREMAKRGHQVTMFTNSYCHFTHVERLAPHEKWRIEEVDGIRVIWLKTVPYTGNGWRRGVNMISNAWRAIQVARLLSDKPDVVLGPSVPLLTGWAAYQIAQMKDAAFVFEVRDIWPISLVENGGLSRNSPMYHIFRYIEKFLYKKSYGISAVLPLTRQHVAESGGDSSKVVWIPNGVDFERFVSASAYDGGREYPLVAMYIGGFSIPHDVISIVRAASSLQQRGVNQLRFVIVGNGIKKLDCQKEAEMLRLSNLEFRAPVMKSEIPKLQMEADILIACVTDSPIYRFGINLNKLFDYLASSRPIIFAGNAPNDPVAESGSGFSVPPENPEAMAEALKKFMDMPPEERIEMGKRGRHYVENEFDIRKLAERMERLLTQAISIKEKMNATRRTKT